MTTAFAILEVAAQQLKNIRLHLKFLRLHFFSDEPFVAFICNICGKSCHSPLNCVMNRELASCYHCGSNRRFRTIAAVLTEELLGNYVILKRLIPQKKFRGIGMSDATIYARYLKKKFNYQNTFYHRSPHLDICNINKNQHNSYDFIITSDVFEHVPPPVDKAFINLYNLLKPGGVCVFSVPFHLTGRTQEHYPQLHNYQISKQDGQYILENTTATGEKQVFENLRFHGGPGATLEMRFFAQEDLLENLE